MMSWYALHFQRYYVTIAICGAPELLLISTLVHLAVHKCNTTNRWALPKMHCLWRAGEGPCKGWQVTGKEGVGGLLAIPNLRHQLAPHQPYLPFFSPCALPDTWSERLFIIHYWKSKNPCFFKTSQVLRMLPSVTINCQVTKIVINSGSQLSEL